MILEYMKLEYISPIIVTIMFIWFCICLYKTNKLYKYDPRKRIPPPVKSNKTKNICGNTILSSTADIKDLLSLLAEHGGTIVSSKDLHPNMIAQARLSNRLYVDENSLGYVWKPVFAGRFPMTENEIVLFERCYPIEGTIRKR